MSLSPFRRKELAAFVQDLARGEITAPPGDVVFLHQDLAKLLREHEAALADAERLAWLGRQKIELICPKAWGAPPEPSLPIREWVDAARERATAAEAVTGSAA